MNVEKFWQEKEKATKSRLITRTAANYKSGYPGLENPVEGGLLYLMENGFYFENFQSTNFLANVIFKQDFEKISFHIPLDKVADVYDYFGNKKPEKKTFIEKFKHLFSQKPRELNIEYTNDDNEKMKITFITFVDPVTFCEEYYKLV
jgi:hypothetical protein